MRLPWPRQLFALTRAAEIAYPAGVKTNSCRLPAFLLAIVLMVGACLPQTLSAQGVLFGGAAHAAGQFLDLLVKEDFAEATNRFDTTMRAALSGARLADIWGKVVDQAGPFQEQVRTRTARQGEYDIVVVSCRFEKQMVDVKVVFNAGLQVSGLFFAPGKPDTEYVPPAYVVTNAFAEKEVTVGSGEWALPGTLTLPVGVTNLVPGVVLVHGSGPNDRDETLLANKPFRDLAWGLASRGIAVLRYEKRTRAHASKFAQDHGLNLTLKEETVDDAVLAAELLRGSPGVHPYRVYVLGHSLGGQAAPRIALADTNLAGLIFFAGTIVRSLEDMIADQNKYLVTLNTNMTSDDQAKYEQLLAQVDKVKSLTAKDAGSRELYLGCGARYWLDLRSHDALASAKKLKLPMLALHGGRDYQVLQSDFEAWRKALAGQPNVTFKLYPDLNHLMVPGEGMSTPAEYGKPGHVDEAVVKDIATWILGR
jgi:dienelactone hydrolase